MSFDIPITERQARKIIEDRMDENLNFNVMGLYVNLIHSETGTWQEVDEDNIGSHVKLEIWLHEQDDFDYIKSKVKRL